jgi:hypothetical protein
MKKYRGAEVQLHVFLASTIEGIDWSISHCYGKKEKDRATFT